MKLVVLAAGQSHRPQPLNAERPVATVPFLGRPLLDWTLSAAKECGIGDVTVVGGYQFETLASYEVRLLKNADYATSSVVGSLMVADQFFGDEFVMSYGDVTYRPDVLRALIASTAEIGVVVDLDWEQYWDRRFRETPAVLLSLRMLPDGTIRSIGRAADRIEDVQGQFAGLVMFRGRGVKALRRAWQRATADAMYRRPILGHCNALSQLGMTDVLDELISGDVPIKAVRINGGWVEIESTSDIPAAEERWASSAKSGGATPDSGMPSGGSAGGPSTGPSSGASGDAAPPPSSLPTFHPVRRWR